MAHLSNCADLLMTTSPNVLVYAALDGWRRQMVSHGHELLDSALNLARLVRRQVDDITGLRVMHDELLHEQASHDLDLLQVLIDVSGLAVSGYQCADWLRQHHHLDVGLSDHRRILATLSFADDEDTTGRLLTALRDMADAAAEFPSPPTIRQPSPEALQLQTLMLPRDAFFGTTEMVPVEEASGRIAAEQITPYPPGIPVVVPGERLNDAVLEYLQTGKEAGMNLPDATDSALTTIKVVHETDDPASRGA